MPFSTKTFFQIISIMQRGSISQTLVNMVRLYVAKRIKLGRHFLVTVDQNSQHSFRTFSFLVLWFYFFYNFNILLCRLLQRYIPSPKTVRSRKSTFTYQSSRLQDSRAIQYCTNIITEGVHRHLTIFRKKDTL